MSFEQFFNFKSNSITSAAGLLAASTVISRLLALVRDGLLAGKFGAGVATDIYFAAFRIPDLVYNFLIAGGLVVAFLPLFSEFYSEDEERAWEFTSNILNIFLVLLVVTCAVLFLLTPLLIDLIAPGFNAAQQAKTVMLTRLMFLSPIFFGLSSIFSGVLHHFKKFLAYALAPVLYNLGIIFGIIVLSPRFGIFGVATGVVSGAFLHWLIQIPAAKKCGFSYKLSLRWNQTVKKMFKLMIPRSLAMASQQINLIVITAIASTIGEGSVAVFNFANNLRRLPIGLVAIPFSVATFPVLSRSWARGEREKFKASFSRTFRGILFLVIPISLLVFILRAHLVRLILGSLGKEFGWQATRLTAASLGLFCIGVFGSALIALVTRAFFALKDTKTPTLVTLVGVTLSIGLSFLLVWVLGFSNGFRSLLVGLLKLEGIRDIAVVGLPLAFSAAMVVQFLVLLFTFVRKMKKLNLDGTILPEIAHSSKKIISASVGMIPFVYLTLYLINPLVNTSTVLGLLVQGFSAGLVGVLVFLVINMIVGTPELQVVKETLNRALSRKSS
ncbi:MAG: murein biosynthesis integral membrane protein MurJ [Candidatus Paceibacterota bacterium]